MENEKRVSQLRTRLDDIQQWKEDFRPEIEKYEDIAMQQEETKRTSLKQQYGENSVRSKYPVRLYPGREEIVDNNSLYNKLIRLDIDANLASEICKNPELSKKYIQVLDLENLVSGELYQAESSKHESGEVVDGEWAVRTSGPNIHPYTDVQRFTRFGRVVKGTEKSIKKPMYDKESGKTVLVETLGR